MIKIADRIGPELRLLGEGVIAEILSQLGSGCVVVGGDLSVLHANAAAKRFFLSDRPWKAQLEFPDLPQELGSKVFAVVKSGRP